MRSLLGRFHRPFARGTEDQLLLLNNLGDGSTLSLDFTTGVLDPRLTFTRLSDATFINSSGRVEWSAANYFRNTGWVTSTTPTGWNVTFGTGTTTWNNDGTVTMNTGGSSTRPCINANSFTVSQGIAYTFGYTVVSASGSPQISNVISSSLVGDTFAINGTTVSGTTVVQAGDVVSCTFTPTGTTASPRMGPGVNGGMTNTAITITRPQMNPGVTLQPYLLNTSTSVANNNTPRFDYDPTSIGTPRGLLIEGSANNLLFWSESFATSGAASNWAYNSNTGAVVTTDNPAGGTTAFQFAETANSGPLQQSATVTNVVHTFSAWFKGSVYNSVTTTQVQFGLFTTGFVAGTASIISGPGSTSVAGNIVTLSGLSTTQWTRVQFTTSAAIPAGAVAILIYPQTTAFEVNRSFYIWGAQLETGSGASSYIPTGASQGNRAADGCDCTSGNFSSWYTQGPGTLLVHARPFRQNYSDLASLCTSTSDPRFAIRTNDPPSAAGITLYGNNGGTLVNIKTSNSYSINNLLKTAVGLQQGNYAVVLNGGTVNIDPGTGTFPTALNRLTIGHTALGAEANAWISLIKYWPTRLPNAQLQSLTT